MRVHGSDVKPEYAQLKNNMKEDRRKHSKASKYTSHKNGNLSDPHIKI